MSRRRYQSDRDPPMLPPRVRNWTKGRPQVGAFLRTEEGSTLQMVNDTATEDQKLLILAAMRGAGSIPKEVVEPLLKFMQDEILKKKAAS